MDRVVDARERRSLPCARPMRPTLVAPARRRRCLPRRSLAVAASGVFAAADLVGCTLVASEGDRSEPARHDPRGVSMPPAAGRGPSVPTSSAPCSSPFAERWDGTAWSRAEARRAAGPDRRSRRSTREGVLADGRVGGGVLDGRRPAVEHLDGTSWSLVHGARRSAGASASSPAIDGTSSTDLWLVGQRRYDDQMQGVVLHGGTQRVPDRHAARTSRCCTTSPCSDRRAARSTGWSIEPDGFAAAADRGGSRATPGHARSRSRAEQGRNVFLTGPRGRHRRHGLGGRVLERFTRTATRRSRTQRGDGWLDAGRRARPGGSARLVVGGERTSTGPSPSAQVSTGGLVAGARVARRPTAAGPPIPGAGDQPPDSLAGVALDGADVWAVGRARRGRRHLRHPRRARLFLRLTGGARPGTAAAAAPTGPAAAGRSRTRRACRRRSRRGSSTAADRRSSR